jgi:hypothetical protein
LSAGGGGPTPPPRAGVVAICLGWLGAAAALAGVPRARAAHRSAAGACRAGKRARVVVSRALDLLCAAAPRPRKAGVGGAICALRPPPAPLPPRWRRRRRRRADWRGSAASCASEPTNPSGRGSPPLRRRASAANAWLRKYLYYSEKKNAPADGTAAAAAQRNALPTTSHEGFSRKLI